MAKILEMSRDRESNPFGNVTYRLKVEINGEVFGYQHSYPRFDENLRKPSGDRAFEDFLRQDARQKIGMAIMDKFFPNI